MAEVRLQGLGGIVVLALVAALAAFRFLGLDEIEDSKLNALVQADLEGRAHNVLMDEQQERGDGSARFLSTRVEISDINGSAPLFNFGTSKEYVLRVEFRIIDSDRATRNRTRYLRAHHDQLTDRWRLLTGAASQVDYYLNFY